MIKQITNIDFKKYKRVFIFGCSFTNYIWPTWANIIHLETNKGTPAYNYGAAGGGNIFITCTLMAANQKHRFNKDDLVLLMWSTFCREDRYIGHRWEVPGNIWTQNFYDEKFVLRYSCAKGYTVRDLGLIASATYTMNSLPCDVLTFLSVPPDWDKRYSNKNDFDEVINLYQDVIDSYPPVMYESVKDGSGGWVNGHHYYWPDVNGTEKMFSDYHPNPKMYMKYLMDIGMTVSNDTQDKINTYMSELQQINHHQKIRDWGENIYRDIGNYFWNEHLI